jgi:hypothetical protein
MVEKILEDIIEGITPLVGLTLKEEYIAGLFDGEGCVSIGMEKPSSRRKSPKYYLQAFIVNTYKPVIDYLYTVCGGSVSKSWNGGNRKLIYRWAVNSRMAESFLKLIQPHVIIKQKQLELALEFMNTKTRVRGTRVVPEQIAIYEKYKQKMHTLNKKGAMVNG